MSCSDCRLTAKTHWRTRQGQSGQSYNTPVPTHRQALIWTCRPACTIMSDDQQGRDPSMSVHGSKAWASVNMRRCSARTKLTLIFSLN